MTVPTASAPRTTARPIRLDGQTFRKGLGVAANAQVVYNLDGKYRQFFCAVGIDDSRGTKGQ